MCGINGFNWNSEQLIKQMNCAIKHRGPDGEGLTTQGNVSLGHVRLSILDLSERGRQPMVSLDGNLLITYNGEVYNFKELRKELKSSGYIFSSDTDTEVVLNCYKAYGLDFLNRLNGIFAFCIYDIKQDLLLLARDRLGVKPLYYYIHDKCFIFTSELKALKVLPNLDLKVDEQKFNEYLKTQNIIGESFYENVKCLKPGSYAKYNLLNNSLSVSSYHDVFNEIHTGKIRNNYKKDEHKIVNELDDLLNMVVKDQLVSDAPLGTICSGGLDSSLITAIACQYKKDLKIFNVQVLDDNCDESKYARVVANHLKLDLIEAQLNQNNYANLIDKCIHLEDLPLFHPNSVGIYLISKKAKNSGLSVLLSGEGADELFGGYHQYLSFYKKLIINNLPFLSRYVRKSKKIEDEHLINCFIHKLDNRNNIESKKQVMEDFKKIETILSCAVKDKLQRATLSFISKDLRYYLVPILRRTDRMSMGNGLEMRVPYLDNRLINFAINLPLKFKLRRFNGKYLLKKVATRYLPRNIVYRKKMGFPLPVTKWLGHANFKELMIKKWSKDNLL